MTEELAICPACGGSFNAHMAWGEKEYCSRNCAQRANAYKHHHGTLDGFPVKAIKGSAKWHELNNPRRARAMRLATQDAAYAKLGVAVTVVDRGDVVVENRGTVPIGFGAVSKVKHS